MHPINPNAAYGGEPVEIAKDQPEYNTLPALVDLNLKQALTVWEFTDEERALIASGRNLVLLMIGLPIQPVHLEVEGHGEITKEDFELWQTQHNTD